MKIKSTLIVIGLALGLLSCSYNSGVLKNAQPATQNTSLKSSVASTSGQASLTLHFNAVDIANFDSAGATLDTITLVRKGNVKLGIKEKRVVVWDQKEYFDDLLYMGTGMMGDLLIIPIPPGTYDYAIVHVYDGWVKKDTNGPKYPLKFPSNKMTLAFNPSVTVTTHLSADVQFDVDINKSFVAVNGDSYIFKPHVKVASQINSGSVAGAIIDEKQDTVWDANVYVDYYGFPISVSDSAEIGINDPNTLYGMSSVLQTPLTYWIIGIPGGTYYIYAEKAGDGSASAQITITPGNFTIQNLTLKQ